jgi:DNA-binding transcriptional LysR family regulator
MQGVTNARAGDPLTYLPRVLTRIEEEVGLFAAIDVPGTLWRREVQIARHVRGTLHPAGRALVAEMKQVCLENAGRPPAFA